MRIPADTLRDFVAAIFHAAGCSPDEAGRLAHYLVLANLSGHESHGVLRVPRYVHWVREGTVALDKTVETVVDAGAIAVLDGGHGFGHTIGPQAVRVGVDKARTHGVGLIGLRRAGHLGRIGDWAEMAAEDGIASIHFVNTTGLGLIVAPFGSADRRMSTNPISIGVPVGDGPPLVLDCATSTVAEGKVLNALSGGPVLPDDALITADGTLSGDPRAIYGDAARPMDDRSGGGAIRAMAAHKGAGLSFMCELLAGALTGSGCARPGTTLLDNGMLSIYVVPEILDAGGGFADEVARYVSFFKSARPAPPGGAVLSPGEIEQATRKARARDGVPLPETVWQSLIDTAEAVAVAPARIARAAEAGVAGAAGDGD